MEGRVGPAYKEQAQRLADLQEYLDLVRYPARAEMLRAVNEAAERAESRARLDLALRYRR